MRLAVSFSYWNVGSQNTGVYGGEETSGSREKASHSWEHSWDAEVGGGGEGAISERVAQGQEHAE